MSHMGKPMNRRSYMLIVALSLVALVSSTASGQTITPPKAVEEKPVAPPFSLTSLEGEKLELSALRGKVVVLNFWFTGCVPCIAEFSELNRLVKDFSDKGVVFIAPTLDNEDTLKPFLKEHKFNYRVVPNAIRLIAGTYSDGSGEVVFPTHIVISQDGKIYSRVTGEKGIKGLRKALSQLTSVEIEKAK